MPRRCSSPRPSPPGCARRAAIAVATTLVVVSLGACTSATSTTPPATSAPGGTATPPATAPSGTVVNGQPCGTKHTHAYAEHPGVVPNLTSIDVYTPPASETGTCADRSLVVWIHGGGWTGGDKSEHMTDKVTLFNGAGYVFASVNYRVTDKTKVPPSPQHPVHDQDAADALGWLVAHAPDIGVDPERIAVLGHSAGGGITAALATDEQYLGRSGVALDQIDCAASMDGEGYDIVAGATTSPPEVQAGYKNVFGTDPAVWASASPIQHIAAGKGIPDFFVAARGGDWRLDQHLAFIQALQAAGVATTVLDSRALEHADLATDVGAPGDTVVTPPLMDFLAACFAP